jgi:N-acetylglucosamine kinase-like BadF-type ATPase
VVKAVGKAGCGDYTADGNALHNVAQAINNAFDQANARKCGDVTRANIEYAVFSMAGADFPEDIAKLEKEIRERKLVLGAFTVMNDAFGALFAGSITGFGVSIAAGTFANTAARHDVRGSAREWCHGYYQSMGGGTALGTRAYEAVLAAAVGTGEATSLTKALLEAASVFSVEELMYNYARRSHQCKPLKEFAEVVLTEAAAGDAVAMRIVEQEAETLACYAKAAADKVGLVRHVPIVLAGGVFNHASDLLPKLIERKMQEKLPTSRVSVSTVPPVGGAVLRAFELNGRGSGMFIRETLERSLREHIDAG